MQELLYGIVGIIAQIHTYILNLNDSYEYAFTDKELHFLVIGALGICLILLIHPVFRFLANRGHIMVVTFFYVITVLIVITFAIEIGQGVTGTGNMEFADIVYGIGGFLAMFFVYLVIRGIFLLIKRWVTKGDEEWY